MMQTLKEIYKNNKIVIISAASVLLLGVCIMLLVGLFVNHSSIKRINNENYAIQYDKTWKIKEKKENSIVLKHSSGSKVTIQIAELADEYRYSSIDDLIDEVIYSVQKQNSNYKLISKNEDKLTKYKYKGYKLLYENDKEQAMLCLYKKSDKLITIRYEADDRYFDILLDSVHYIIYNLNVKDKKFDLKQDIKLETSNIEYSKNDKLDKKLKDVETYEVASNHYLVKYNLPKIFERKTLDSKLGQFEYRDGQHNIYLTTSILNRNIYEYLDKDEEYGNVYNDYKYYHEKGNKDYSDFKESVAKLDGKQLGYIYKNTYTNNNAYDYTNTDVKKAKESRESVELLYALDNNHFLIIKLEAKGMAITQKLIDMIKPVESINYASYVIPEKEDNFLIGKLQGYVNYDYNNIRTVTIKIPDKYKEIDKNTNVYEERNYAYNYNEDIDNYDYTVRYKLLKTKPDDYIKIINNTYIKTAYGASKYLTYSGDLTVNDNKFKVYDGGYTDISGIMFTSNRIKYYVNKKVLFYEMPDDGNLYVEIDGNDKTITNDVINELVNFTVETKKK
ncbi:MAG: hypothetical protein IJI58_04585 [Bacilli bacterium]|nr:hypothetical protein [Bacilli bacterium]